ncbi:MAG: exo-alpha-sialidase [Bryobacterales bacterium]|nr:exo-alpha-sialidase [Bryobacterales bacterium]
MWTRCLILFIAAGLAQAAEPLLSHIDVFRSGTEGYHTFRIPAIVKAPDGTLLAFAEARKENRSDPGGGDIDLVVKRSTDQGAAWSPLVVLDDPGEKWSASNPTPVTDRDRKRVWIFYNRWEPGRGTAESQPGASHNQTWTRYSDDNGRSWSAPRDITRSARDYDNWGAMFLGPGGGIQTRGGRLLIPAAAKFDEYGIWVSVGGFHGTLNVLRAYALLSDDHGETWRRGRLLQAFTNENQLVELAGGEILMDARQGDGGHRWRVISTDGGQTWSTPRPGQAVTEIAAGIERYTLKSRGDDRNRILWTGPAGPGRNNLVIRISYDEGQTFRNERLIYGGLAAYSDLEILGDGTVGVLWERGVAEPYQFITFTRCNREFLEPPGSVTPVVR